MGVSVYTSVTSKYDRVSRHSHDMDRNNERAFLFFTKMFVHAKTTLLISGNIHSK